MRLNVFGDRNNASSTLPLEPSGIHACPGGMDSQQILSFYMGKNTPERKDYIMENLVVPVEE